MIAGRVQLKKPEVRVGLTDPIPRHSIVAQKAMPPKLLCLLIALPVAACSRQEPPTTLLFAAADLESITTALESAFQDSTCGDLMPTSEVVDLNNDGEHEIFIQWGNTCTSGMTGRSLSLFVKDATGRYQPQLGFPALGWTKRDSATKDWPDLSFGGPGFCHPVWAWSSDQYQFKCNLPETPGGCDSRGKTC